MFLSLSNLLTNISSSCPQHDVVDYCVAKGIVVTAYSPLGSDNSPLLTHDVVKRIADKYGVGTGTVLISLPVNRKGVNGSSFIFSIRCDS
jgi:diketogulonate reductase-like aldo/keto reductase